MAEAEKPVEKPTESDDGVDITLIRWMLSLTPEERLAALQGFVDSVEAMRPVASGSGSPSDPSS